MTLKDSFRPVRIAERLSLQRGSRRRAAVLAAVGSILLAGGLVGIIRGGGGEAPRIPEAGRGTPTQRVSFLAKLIPPEPERRAVPGPRVPRSLADLARRLPLERKVAQLFLVGFRGRDLSAVVYQQLRRLDLGGIVIDRGNYSGPQVLSVLAGEPIVIAEQVKHIPPWVMAPQEGGEENAFPDLPPADAPVALRSAGAGGAQAARAGATLGALGITGVLAPVVDVGPVDEPVLGPRIYSDNPRAVAGYASAVVRAYRRAGVFSAVKHFPGLGAASQPTEEGPATVGLKAADLRRRDLVPFRAAFRAGAPGVVLSSALYSLDDFTTPASLSHRIATDLLRRELRFRGVAITDDLADPAITTQATVPDAAVRAVRAGADMLFVSGPAGDQQAAYVAVLRAVRSGQISRHRLNQALLRILAAKRRYGLIR
jgi:beta-N-acetylhexosaminidase